MKTTKLCYALLGKRDGLVRTIIIVIFVILHTNGCISDKENSAVLSTPSSDFTILDLSNSSVNNEEKDMHYDMMNVQDGSSVNMLEDSEVEEPIDYSDLSILTDQSFLMTDMEPIILDEGLPSTYTSSRQSTRIFNFEHNRSMTRGNPFKGFTTNYAWGEPNNDFPHSMEFTYIPLSDLIDISGNYGFDHSLEPILNAAAERRHHSIIRVYLDYPALESAIPLNIRDQISCNPYDDHGGGCSPDYDDPQLQTVILNFIESFGALYDGDSRIAFIQVGLLGFWGEWHTYPHTEWFADSVFQQDVIATFDQAFSITPIQLRIPAQDSPTREIGFHDDSFGYSTLGDIPWFFWPRMVAAMADQRWEIAPMGGEIYPPLQSLLFTPSYLVGTYSQDPLLTIEATHMTYLLNYQAFNLNGTGYTGLQRDSAEEAAQTMGYEYTVEGVELQASNLNDHLLDLQVAVSLRNSGIAPFYYPITMKMTSNTSGMSWSFDYDLKSLSPSATSMTLSINLLRVSVSELSDGFMLSLSSPYLFEDQVINWANTQQEDGLLMIPNQLNCLFNSSSIGLSEVLVTSQGRCFCDVDGQFYTLDGQPCLE
jgi:hypothetical protein